MGTFLVAAILSYKTFSSPDYARTKIQLPSERPDSNLLFKAKNVCVALKLRQVCVFEVVTI